MKWAVLTILFAALAGAQDTGISGLIRDGSGRVVPYATVGALDTQTGQRRHTECNNAGFYGLTGLQPGTYKVSVRKEGFATSIRDRLRLGIAGRVRLDFSLSLGTVETVIQVESSPDLSFEDGALSTALNSTLVSEFPQYLRGWEDLALLVAGVNGYRYTEQPGSPSSHKHGQFSVHGGRQTQNNWLLDGVDNNSFSTNTSEDTQLMVRPSIDAVEEIRVITSPYSAGYGRSPGAAISVLTRSGSNELHGSLYESARNRVFDANTFFANRDGLEKPRNNQNLFGGTIAGPILRNRLFWLIDYEGTRTRQGILRQTSVPLPDERAGIFASATIYDPATNAPFPGNRIPLNQLDSAAMKIQSYFPQPNIGTRDVNNFARLAAIVDDTDRYSGRVDWHPANHDSFFLRYSYTPHHRDVPGFFGGIADGTNTAGWGNRDVNSEGAVIAWTKVLSPRTVNEFRSSFNRTYSFITQEPFGANQPSDFIPGIASDPLSDGGIPQTTIRGYTFIGSPDYLPGLETPTQIQFNDTISWNTSGHALKFGADWRTMRNVWRDIPATRGSVDFNGQFSCQRGPDNLCAAGTGLAFPDFLMGSVQEASLSNLFVADQRLSEYSFFVQDDWRAAQRLTVNLGLRYDFGSTPWEGRNRMANFDPAGQGSLYHAASGSLQERTLTRQDRVNFGPRAGLAFALNSATVLRAGYGMFFALFTQNGSDDQLALNPPEFVNNDTRLPATAAEPVFRLQEGFTAGYLAAARALTLHAANSDYKSPNMQQWSFGVDRLLPASLVLELNYVGSKSTHVRYAANLNQRAGGLRPYPGFGPINWFENYANANYNGLEMTLKRRLLNRLTFLAAYTYSKSIDDAGGENLTTGNSGIEQNSRDRAANRAASDADTRHRFSTAFVYTLPRAAGGFELSGSVIASSGRPFTVFASSNNAAIDSNSYADVSGHAALPHSVDCWYYTAASRTCPAFDPNGIDVFATPRPGAFGNSGRNVLRGPEFASIDLALQREFRSSEHTRLLARWEVFNAGSHASQDRGCDLG